MRIAVLVTNMKIPLKQGLMNKFLARCHAIRRTDRDSQVARVHLPTLFIEVAETGNGPRKGVLT
jgi:hypothetical protein